MCKWRGFFERGDAPPQRKEPLEAYLFHEVIEAVTGSDRDDSADSRDVPEMSSPETQKGHG